MEGPGLPLGVTLALLSKSMPTFCQRVYAVTSASVVGVHAYVTNVLIVIHIWSLMRDLLVRVFVGDFTKDLLISGATIPITFAVKHVSPSVVC